AGLRYSPASAPLGGPGPVRSGPLPPGAGGALRAHAVHALRCRTADLYRDVVRHGRGDGDPGHARARCPLRVGWPAFARAAEPRDAEAEGRHATECDSALSYAAVGGLERYLLATAAAAEAMRAPVKRFTSRTARELASSARVRAA